MVKPSVGERALRGGVRGSLCANRRIRSANSLSVYLE